jgi:hypothetical protein
MILIEIAIITIGRVVVTRPLGVRDYVRKVRGERQRGREGGQEEGGEKEKKATVPTVGR